MNIAKALITAAGRDQRHLPLQTIVDREGYPRPVLTHLIEEAVSAGIEKIGVVISPGDSDLYQRAAGPHAGLITFIEQPAPDGYGDAIRRGAPFLGEDPFLLMVSDHVYVSRDPARSCARQLVEIAAAERCVVSAVQSTHESTITSFGTVGGRLFDGRPGLYRVERVVEKPTPTRAEQELMVPGLRLGHYLCFLGMHVLTRSVLDTLERLLAAADDPRSVNLATALDDFDKRERYLAAEISGRRFDLDERYGLLTAQLALALDGPRRAEILETVVALLADVR